MHPWRAYCMHELACSKSNPCRRIMCVDTNKRPLVVKNASNYSCVSISMQPVLDERERNHTFMGSDLPFIVTGPLYSKWKLSSKLSSRHRYLQNFKNYIQVLLEVLFLKFIIKRQSHLVNYIDLFTLLNTHQTHRKTINYNFCHCKRQKRPPTSYLPWNVWSKVSFDW